MEEPLKVPRSIRVREVGPRDGIQSEKAQVSTEDKARLIDALSATGLRAIEAVSFVSSRAVPQMADAADVLARITRRPGVFYSALVPNRRGAEAAAEAEADGMQVFVAATDSYNERNVGRSVRASLEDVRDVVEIGRDAHLAVEGTISVAFGCPYEGDVSPARAAEVSTWIADLGISSISYGDTTGMASPRRVAEVVEAVRKRVPGIDINMHFHDTRGAGLANVLAAMHLGVGYFDSSIGGMGGSPFAEGATGNIATEDLVHMVHDMGVQTGVDLQKLLEAARLTQGLVAGELPGRVLKAGSVVSAG